MVRRIRTLWPLWVVLAAVLAVVLVLFLPPLLIAPYGLKDPEKRLAAENAMRTTLAGTFGGLAVIAGAIVGALNFRETQRQNRLGEQQNRDQLKLSRRGQYTERFSKAIEQLGQEGDGKLDVRIGAIYALEQIAKDSGDLHWPIMEVLATHLRHFRRTRQPARGAEESTTEEPEQAGLPTEAQAIATVIGRRRYEQDPPNQRLDLHEVDLNGVLWEKAHLEKADLSASQLEKANLGNAHLEGAWIVAAHLEGAVLLGAHLGEANLGGAQLEKANLVVAHLKKANLGGAQLEEAKLDGAQLEGADLSGALLKGASLFRAHLEKAQLKEAKLDGAHLEGAYLRGAHLAGASLGGTDIEGVDLTDSEDLTWAQVQAAKNWEKAKLPGYVVAQRAEPAGLGPTARNEEPRLDAAGAEQASPDQ